MCQKNIVLGMLLMVSLVVCLGASGLLTAPSTSDDSAVWAAICPVVYPLDQTSSERGYHYIFYGNGFFISKQGYLLTAAHVLTDFHDGGQPHILVSRPEAPARIIKVEVLATDAQHDIALLRAVPNPFEGKYEVASLALAANKPDLGAIVFAAALRPSQLRDPHTFDAPEHDQDQGEVLQYTTIKLDKAQPEAELFLFNHQVLRGQSGAPVLSADGRKVVGIVEGQWLHSTPLALAEKQGGSPSIGAAIPISYATALLDQQHISWNTGPENQLAARTRRAGP